MGPAPADRVLVCCCSPMTTCEASGFLVASRRLGPLKCRTSGSLSPVRACGAGSAECRCCLVTSEQAAASERDVVRDIVADQQSAASARVLFAMAAEVDAFAAALAQESPSTRPDTSVSICHVPEMTRSHAVARSHRRAAAYCSDRRIRHRMSALVLGAFCRGLRRRRSDRYAVTRPVVRAASPAA